MKNTIASPVCVIKIYLGKIAYFIVKETHHVHNSVTELDIAKLKPFFFSMFHDSAPADNRV